MAYNNQQGFQQGQTDDSTGTEVSWSMDKDAWKSNNGPETWDFTFSDGARTIDGTRYSGSATVYIRGLEKGESYYFRVLSRNISLTISSGWIPVS